MTGLSTIAKRVLRGITNENFEIAVWRERGAITYLAISPHTGDVFRVTVAGDGHYREDLAVFHLRDLVASN